MNNDWKLISTVVEHYKGGRYTVLFECQDSTNGTDRQEMVVYCSHTTGQIYCRNKAEFWGTVELLRPSGIIDEVPRFKMIDSKKE